MNKLKAEIDSLVEGFLDIFSGKKGYAWTVLIVAVVIVCGVAAGCYVSSSNSTAVQSDISAGSDTKILLRVEPGMTSSEIGEALLEKGIIDSKWSFWWNTKRRAADSKFQVGLFELHPNMEVDDVIDILITGKIASVKFTIPEGFTVTQIAERLSEKGLVNEKNFLEIAKNYAPYDYIEKNDKANYRIEGFLFPATYVVGTDATPEQIMDVMAEALDDRLTADMKERAAEQGLSIYELITLASLVEREARYDEDRPIIAQVFLKRLAIDMPLQSDTTITYLIGAKEDVTYSDTEIDSPYNTYQVYGLPPGPIACPGMDAIEAVLYPADTDFLYFVADRDGHNYYSTNYDDHMALVEEVR